MLKPNDISEKKFEKSAFGYKPEEVDSFLAEIYVAFSEMYEEKAATEEKLEVLAGKVEEYRASEDSLKTVLVGAQKLGDNIIRDAKAKAEVILNDAENQMKQAYADSESKIIKEKETLLDLQKKTADFKKDLLAMYKQHLELISLMPEAETPAAEDEAPAAEEETPAEVSEIDIPEPETEDIAE